MSLFDETERRPLSVTELTFQVRSALEARFASVWVEGEISNFKAAASGHWYFTIKDEGAQLHAKCFRGVNGRIRFRPSDGLQVRVRGRLSVYEPRGEYELIVEALDPVGAGALRVAFEQMRDRLAAEGLFDEELKQPLPLFPRRVGVVTSPTGAAIRDILTVLARRTRTVHVLFAPTRVQGEGASAEIAQAIRLLNDFNERALAEGRADECIDVIIVGRGGGSAEDLWAFNEEGLARAIRASLIPVISAVGHETDVTIADFAADLRAPTPSAAAELVAAREDELAAYVLALTRDLVRSARSTVVDARLRVQEAAMSPAFDEARERLHAARARGRGGAQDRNVDGARGANGAASSGRSLAPAVARAFGRARLRGARPLHSPARGAERGHDLAAGGGASAPDGGGRLARRALAARGPQARLRDGRRSARETPARRARG